ncbi:MAG: PD-(D/E)XK nuclease family protein [Deltaproteobacteria bacterium]|nr:PD-(D/E)XK nuclease family protein [Deltaproteobacteria bacterium]
MSDPKFQTWLTDHLFTPSEFEDFLLCPFRFYVESYLGLEPIPPQEPELTPLEIGTLIHRILQFFFEKHAKEIGISSKDKLQASLRKITVQTLESYQKNRPHLIPALLSFQKERIEKTLTQVLEKEISMEQTKSSLKPTTFEWSFGKKGPLELPDGKGGGIRIKGRIDRIDVDHESKRFLIIDYKTGSQKITGNQLRRGEAFQLPLYLLAVQKLLLPEYEPIGGLYYHLSDLSMDAGMIRSSLLPDGFKIHPSSSSFFSEIEWKELFETTTKHLQSIVQEIREEKFPSREEPCEPWCPWKDLCKIRSFEISE